MIKLNAKELKVFGWFAAFFLALYYLPAEATRFQGALSSAFKLAKWYAREHVLLCLVPAFLIAGAIAVFVSQGAVMKYFGSKANKLLSYGVASISGSILAVCSCTVLPIFGGIYALGIEATIEKVTNVTDIVRFGVMLTPALVVDGKVECAGRVLSIEEVKTTLLSRSRNPK